jgi:hypothetical protein
VLAIIFASAVTTMLVGILTGALFVAMIVKANGTFPSVDGFIWLMYVTVGGSTVGGLVPALLVFTFSNARFKPLKAVPLVALGAFVGVAIFLLAVAGKNVELFFALQLCCGSLGGIMAALLLRRPT